jgi:hypothetical protein
MLRHGEILQRDQSESRGKLPRQHLTKSHCRASGQRQQALYCMKRAVAVDPNDVNLLWEHAMMAKEFGEDEAVSLRATNQHEYR